MSRCNFNKPIKTQTGEFINKYVPGSELYIAVKVPYKVILRFLTI